MKPSGKFQASIYGETKGNVLLRRKQYRTADDEEMSLSIAKNMMLGKFSNCRYLLRKGKNDHKDVIDANKIDLAIEKINKAMADLDDIKDKGSLRGLEGDTARCYFDALDELILKEKDEFYMRGRSRRPPRDKMNALLSFLYSMLANEVRSSLESVGLDSYVGFLHTDRPGRASLALDVMEEMRPIADRVALTLINLRKISPDGFIEQEGGGVLMTEDTRRIVIEAWQTRKTDETVHPFLGEKIQIGLIPHVQSMLLSRYLRGDTDGYPPFVMKQVPS
jgi:CRISPR-associated protein Cas1